MPVNKSQLCGAVQFAYIPWEKQRVFLPCAAALRAAKKAEFLSESCRRAHVFRKSASLLQMVQMPACCCSVSISMERPVDAEKSLQVDDRLLLLPLSKRLDAYEEAAGALAAVALRCIARTRMQCTSSAGSRWAVGVQAGQPCADRRLTAGHRQDPASAVRQGQRDCAQGRDQPQVHEQGVYPWMALGWPAGSLKTCMQVLPNLGLCIALFDIEKSSEGIILHGDGCIYHKSEPSIRAALGLADPLCRMQSYSGSLSSSRLSTKSSLPRYPDRPGRA